LGAAQREPKFRQALLREAAQSILDGDLPTGKAVLRDSSTRPSAFRLWEIKPTFRRKASCAC
jgi:hypothetical protein